WNKDEFKLKSGSVQIVITDPPYPKEDVPIHSDLAILCRKFLEDGGHLLSMEGSLYLPEILSRFGQYLVYRYKIEQQFAIHTPAQGDGFIIQDQGSKPILWFTKGKLTHRISIKQAFIEPSTSEKGL